MKKYLSPKAFKKVRIASQKNLQIALNRPCRPILYEPTYALSLRCNPKIDYATIQKRRP